MKNLNLDISTSEYALELKIIYECFNKTNLTLEQSNYLDINKRIIKQLKYRLIASNIILIVSTWEQQLTDYIYKSDNIEISGYNKIKEHYIKNFKVDEKIFEKLSEYRNIVNVLKHGKNGDSFRKLLKRNSKFLESSIYFEDLYDSVAFRLPILNIEDSDVKKIGEEFIDFWHYMYLKFE